MKLRISDIIWGLVGGIAALCCIPTPAIEGGKYSVRLEECNRQAHTLCESIACENEWRAHAGRPSRELPNHCIVKDAGNEHD